MLVLAVGWKVYHDTMSRFLVMAVIFSGQRTAVDFFGLLQTVGEEVQGADDVRARTITTAAMTRSGRLH